MSKYRQKSGGFTLVELLIVIAIISILAAFGLGGAFMTSRKKAVDASRKGDIKAIQTALEQYRLVNGVYPANLAGFNGGVNGQPGYLPVPINVVNITTTLTASSPIGLTTTASAYCVCALLSATSPGGNAASQACAYTVNAGNKFFCTSNLQ